MNTLEIGRLLRASTQGCMIGCQANQLDAPTFGSMVRIPLEDADRTEVYGLVYDIHIDDDMLVRQLVTAGGVSEDVLLDNRNNRNVPLEISVLFLGYTQSAAVFHLLPPRPPLTLEAIYPVSNKDLTRFTGVGRFGYFRHVLRSREIPVGEVLAAHIQQAARAHNETGNLQWLQAATQELITLLRDDYPALVNVLGALADAHLTW